ESNLKYIADKEAEKDAQGKAVYTRLVPTSWNSQGYILIRYYNDTMLTKDNLKPMLTSTVDVKYRGHDIDGVVFDSSFWRTSPADSVYRTKPSSVVEGWTIALMNMHIGDSCEVIIPYQQGYGSGGSQSILPYSTLIFDMKLVGIPAYETKP
ncbi:MAG: FKBP-type peptidyl-prolyl cis-trans isomerase, partial [Muribaculaceae bacterium]